MQDLTIVYAHMNFYILYTHICVWIESQQYYKHQAMVYVVRDDYHIISDGIQ